MVLFINACVRKESRTEKLALALLENLGEYKEIKLKSEGLSPLDEATLEKRTELASAGNFDDKMFSYAKDFASADEIVIAAPFWDGSFPAILKTYLENIYVVGLVSAYSENGKPVGLCKAKKLYYLTTAGGPYFKDFSYGYLKVLATDFFGIKDTELIYAENLDVIGSDLDAIMEKAIKELKK